jgi:hypothetical protein
MKSPANNMMALSKNPKPKKGMKLARKNSFIWSFEGSGTSWDYFVVYLFWGIVIYFWGLFRDRGLVFWG